MKVIKKCLSFILILCLLLSTSVSAIAPVLTQGQINIVKRARQLAEIQWTPLQDVYQWEEMGVFESGETVTGVPYGQPISNGCYIGWTIGLSTFLTATTDIANYFYSEYSTYNQLAPLYSSDCSAFVSYAWKTSARFTTASIMSYSYTVKDQSVNSILVGDALSYSPYHMVLVTNTDLDEIGNVIGVEITELTTPGIKVTTYGSLGDEYTIEDFNERFFETGYILYRYLYSHSVTYTHNCAVPIDGDYCSLCSEPVPVSEYIPIENGKSVMLTSANENATLYYTLDGTEPSIYSEVYTEPIPFTEDGCVRVLAVSDDFCTNSELTINVQVKQVDTASIEAISGMVYENLVVAGSEIALVSEEELAVIYYTTDGTEASIESEIYTEPLIITEDTIISTLVVCDGFHNSEVAYHNLTIGETNTLSLNIGVGGTSLLRGMNEALTGVDFPFYVEADVGYTLANITINGEWSGETLVKEISEDTLVNVTFQAEDTLPFSDVSLDAWYHTAVYCVYQNGMFAGVAENLYGPDYNMTGEMFMIVLSRLIENSESFEPEDFIPENDITREEMAVLLYDYILAAGFELPVYREAIDFSDSENISEDALEAITALYMACILNGTEKAEFLPNDFATRAEVAQIFANLYYATLAQT